MGCAFRKLREKRPHGDSYLSTTTAPLAAVESFGYDGAGGIKGVGSLFLMGRGSQEVTRLKIKWVQKEKREEPFLS